MMMLFFSAQAELPDGNHLIISNNFDLHVKQKETYY